MIDVCCALIVDENGAVLVAQRSKKMKLPLKWEFPGGKIESGESAEQCIVREIEEELGIAIKILNSLPSNEYHYDDFSIRLQPFLCKQLSGIVSLNEHAAYLWLSPDALVNLDWAAADIPVLEHFLKFHQP